MLFNNPPLIAAPQKKYVRTSEEKLAHISTRRLNKQTAFNRLSSELNKWQKR